MAQEDTAAVPSGQPGGYEALRPYVVDLEDGKFSGEPGATGNALLKSVPADVDAIFSTHLPAFAASLGGGPLPVVFWAHGGLVSESTALATAQQLVPWWLANGVYPISFVWHSGLWETLGNLLADYLREAVAAGAVAPQTALGPPFTSVTNKLIEEFLRRVGGPEVWSAMKENAADASVPGGGAAYVARALAGFQSSWPGMTTAHVAGFSAGANFHAGFVPAVVGAGSAVDTCTLLVPSLDTASFKQTLLPLLGHGMGRLAIFGMKEALARADTLAGLYHGSLLMLVSAALDAAPDTPLLGLQQSILEDPELNALFKVAPATGPAEAVWSVTTDGPLDARSSATTHTAFHTDVPTMDSLMRRVTGRDDIVSFGTTAHARILDALSSGRV